MTAEKDTTLSIIIRTVDKATAGIRAVNKRLDEMTRPTREFGKALKELGEKSGFNSVVDRFKDVGSAASDVIGKVAMIGGVVAGAAATAVAGLVSLVDRFEALGKTAERTGVEADFLAGMRYAATKTGATVEQLDEGIQTFVQNMGQATAGTGRMFKFLQEHASPVLLRQLLAAHGTTEQLGLLADAMAKLKDRSKLLALAQKTLGDSALATLFHEGSKGIMEQMAAYARLAGPQQGAVDGATAAGEAMKDMHAAVEGVEAALVTGLSPALTEVVGKITDWLVGHRSDIARWAEDLGKKIPGAADEVIAWLGKAYDKASTFIDSIGGWKGVIAGVAAVIAGPLVASVAALGVAMVATPFGQVLLGLTAITAAILKLTGATEGFEDVAERLGFTPKKKQVDIGGGVMVDQEYAADREAMMEDGRRRAKVEAAIRAANEANPTVQKMRLLQDQQDAMLAIPDNDPGARAHALNVKFFGEKATREAEARARAQLDQQATIKIDITGAPRGTRASIDPGSTARVDLTVGHQMGAFP